MESRRPGITAIFNRLRKEKPRTATVRIISMAKQEWHDTHGVNMRATGGTVHKCRECGASPELVEIKASRNANGYWMLSCPTRKCRAKWAARGLDYAAAVSCWNEKQEAPKC
jgi:hypothetical protein